MLLREEYQRTGEEVLLEEALQISDTVLSRTTSQHPHYTIRLKVRASLLRDRYLRNGSRQDLDQAITMNRQGLALPDQDAEQMGGHRVDLAVALYMLYSRDHGVTTLRECLSLLHQHLVDTDEPAVPLMADLSAVMTAYARRESNPDILDAAVEMAMRAVSHSSRDDLRAGSLKHLADARALRAWVTQSASDAEAALSARRTALGLLPSSHPHYRVLATDFADAVAWDADLTEATAVARTALAVTPTDHYARPRTLLTLGRVLLRSYDATRRIEDLNEGLMTLREAVEHPALSPSGVVHGLAVLAESTWRFQSDAQSAADLYRRAVKVLVTQVVPKDLAWTDQEYLLRGEAALLQDAVALIIQAGDISGAVEVAEFGRGVLLARAFDAQSDLTQLREQAPTRTNT